jgi:hypothetical protein
VWSYYSDKILDKDFPPPTEPTEYKYLNVQEADEKWANKSADDLEKLGIKGITLRDRLLFEIEYFKEMREHLDIKNFTLCSGSRHTGGGGVPSVYWRLGRLFVRACKPSNADVGLRVREQFPLKLESKSITVKGDKTARVICLDDKCKKVKLDYDVQT